MGHHLGLAFQMADDLLDYTQHSATLGKRSGADLREGKLTLPLIHALSRASAVDRRRMMAMLEDPEFSDEAFAGLVEMLHQYDGIAYTRARATEHVGAARTALDGFEPCRSRDTLADIADYALVRKA